MTLQFSKIFAARRNPATATGRKQRSEMWWCYYTCIFGQWESGSLRKGCFTVSREADGRIGLALNWNYFLDSWRDGWCSKKSLVCRFLLPRWHPKGWGLEGLCFRVVVLKNSWLFVSACIMMVVDYGEVNEFNICEYIISIVYLNFRGGNLLLLFWTYFVQWWPGLVKGREPLVEYS